MDLRESTSGTCQQPPTHYALEVCRYCGKQAKWPGCQHWQTHEGWTVVVKVVTAERDRNWLRVLMNAEQRRCAIEKAGRQS